MIKMLDSNWVQHWCRAQITAFTRVFYFVAGQLRLIYATTQYNTVP